MMRDVYNRNILVFKQTRELSLTKFKDETDNMLANTQVFDNVCDISVKPYKGKQEIEFSKEGSVTEGYLD